MKRKYDWKEITEQLNRFSGTLKEFSASRGYDYQSFRRAYQRHREKSILSPPLKKVKSNVALRPFKRRIIRRTKCRTGALQVELNSLLSKLKALPETDNDLQLFNKISATLKFLTRDRTIVCHSTVFYGKKYLFVNKRKICLHVNGGRIDRFDHVEPDGSLQSFKV